jgi:hypothetical protein
MIGHMYISLPAVAKNLQLMPVCLASPCTAVVGGGAAAAAAAAVAVTTSLAGAPQPSGGRCCAAMTPSARQGHADGAAVTSYFDEFDTSSKPQHSNLETSLPARMLEELRQGTASPFQR